MFELEYRQFQQVFRPRSTFGMDRQDTNRCGERSFYGASFIWFPFRSSRILLGKYRDKTMAYGILEYRHMFGSVEKYKSGNFWAKCGFVGWVGTGTIGNAPIVDWNKWKFNYGVGLRIQMQPGKNFPPRRRQRPEPKRNGGLYEYDGSLLKPEGSRLRSMEV